MTATRLELVALVVHVGLVVCFSIVLTAVVERAVGFTATLALAELLAFPLILGAFSLTLGRLRGARVILEVREERTTEFER